MKTPPHEFNPTFPLYWVTKSVTELKEVWDVVRSHNLHKVVDLERIVVKVTASKEEYTFHLNEKGNQFLRPFRVLAFEKRSLVCYANLESSSLFLFNLF